MNSTIYLLQDDAGSFLALNKKNDEPCFIHDIDHSNCLYGILILTGGNEAKSLLSIKSSRGFYLCSEPNGRIICNREERSGWETFEISPVNDNLRDGVDDLFTIKDFHGQNLFSGKQLRLLEMTDQVSMTVEEVSNLFNINPASIGKIIAEATVDIFDPEYLNHLSLIKRQRKENFSRLIKDDKIKIYISNFFHAIESSDANLSQFNLETFSLTESMPDVVNGPPCIVIVNNNEVALTIGYDKWRSIFSNSKNAIFVVWDHDNHHWLSCSTFCALFSDFYIPAHVENIANLSAVNTQMTSIVHCGVSQFLKSDLIELLASDLSQPRKPITGMHRYYPQFRHRNNIVRRLAAHYPGAIGFTDGNHYFHKEYKKNLRFWSGFQSSFVAPVQGDLPIRIFDSISSGSIPIIPHTISWQMEYHKIPCEMYHVYSNADLASPLKIVNSALDQYLQQGANGVYARIKFGIERLHVSTSLSNIINIVLKAFQGCSEFGGIS
jgi:hypothetical protein